MAWACGNCRQVGPARRGAGSTPAACRISQTADGATAMPSFSSSPWIRRWPHSGFFRARRSTSRLIPGVAGGRPGLRVVFLRVQPAVPGQERRGRDREYSGPAPACHDPCQRGEPGPVRRLVPHAADPPARHRVLMPEDQHFGHCRPVAAEQHDDQAECPAGQYVDDLEQHPPSQPSPCPVCRQQCRSTLNRVFERHRHRRREPGGRTRAEHFRGLDELSDPRHRQPLPGWARAKWRFRPDEHQR